VLEITLLTDLLSM